MPNWCSATVEISATEREIKRLKRAIKDGNRPKAERGLLGALVPQPVFQDDQAWYGWNIENWGTKWELSQVGVNSETKTTLELSFDTAWGPALQAFETWADGGAGQFTYTYRYYEPGMQFLGVATHDGICSTDDYVSADTDPERYREIARDEWGDEPWDEEGEEEDADEEDIVVQAPYHPGYEDVTVIDDAGMEDDTMTPEQKALVGALEDLQRAFDGLIADTDPEYTYLSEDIAKLAERVARRAAREDKS